ncbi:MAG: hypothetical protein GTO45_37880 [Candidatus Aminicenantes bacterium]|nr:hypothetical protein [Candidatus Aminicenantes bacterium]NIM80475.1 hypothetical protein [Candidatus Aminicenantes bacterium]NIN23915.1 hypothetical protein [Candidatus Aminicenantes bacterium]NIN47630.1 hypothetical protein [Candidatus Aminicenantes bacterium]NIN90560.1 hypothetical protein [Candidatus Aminicenantes bacterium]
MWECKKCRRELEDEDLTCWSCGGSREDVGSTLAPGETAAAGEPVEESPADWEPEPVDDESQDMEPAKKLRDFAQRLSKNESLDARIIKGKLVVCDQWVVVNRSLVEDILASGIFSNNTIYVCVYSSSQQILVFSGQGLVRYGDERLALFAYEKIKGVKESTDDQKRSIRVIEFTDTGLTLSLDRHFPSEVAREMEGLFTA